jgi:hypothetical protein
MIRQHLSSEKKVSVSSLMNLYAGKKNANLSYVARSKWVTFARQYSYVITLPPPSGSWVLRPALGPRWQPSGLRALRSSPWAATRAFGLAVKPMIPRAGLA